MHSNLPKESPDRRVRESDTSLLSESSLYVISDLLVRRRRGNSQFDLEVPSLTIDRGSFNIIIGPNGSGKSTFMDALGLALSPLRAGRFDLRVSERVTFALTNLSPARKAWIRRNHLGYILQDGGLLPFLSVSQNINLPALISSQTTENSFRDELIDRLKIRPHLHKKPSVLSSGERQRVAIVRALATVPTVVLADEPTGSIDRQSALSIRETLVALAREVGTTIIVITHDAPLFKEQSDYVFRLEPVGDERRPGSRLIHG